MAIKKFPQKKPKFVEYGETLQAVRDTMAPIFVKWIAFLGLESFGVIVDYDPDFKEGSRECWADCCSSWEYKQALITVYLPSFLSSSQEEMESVIVHELMHVMVNEMRQDGFSEKDVPHEERTVVELTAAFLRVQKK
jgi:hypothetical protein